MEELDVLRKEINEVDVEMAHLFERRMKACKKIGEYKKERGLSVKDKGREDALIEKNRALIKDPEIAPYYVNFLKNNIELSCKLQSKVLCGMKVAYCGSAGAYAQLAAKTMFPEAELCAFPDFESAYKSVENGEFDCVVLPLENSYAGEVGSVTDLIFSGSLYVNQVVDMDITHSLIALEGADISDIKKVISHPQALSQCGNYIKKHGFEAEAFSNTALAVRAVLEKNDKSIAAIASEKSIDGLPLKVLDKGINDSLNNTTRFGAFSLAKNVPTKKGKNENFILVFTVENEAGSLAKALNIIGAHGFNMRTLRSRPMKELQWSYYFYLEAEGDINTEDGRDMLTELSAVCAKVKLAGSYDFENVQ